MLGVDTVPPPRDLLRRMGRAEFVRADIRNPLIAKVISQASVDTVVHASLAANPASSGGRTAMKEMNVIGTMQLLAACQKAPSVRRVVLKSTTAVYGSSSRDPALFDETMTPKDFPSAATPRTPSRSRGTCAGSPAAVPTSRSPCCASPTSSARASTPVFTRYFALPVVPTVLGYDARVQLLHEEDALAVLERAASLELPGTFNVAADGVLMLSQAIRRAGRIAIPVPAPAVGPVSRIVRGARLVDFSPEQMRLLNFGRVVDTTAAAHPVRFHPALDHHAGLRRLRARPRAAPGDPARPGSESLERGVLGRREGPRDDRHAAPGSRTRPRATQAAAAPRPEARIIPLHADESGPARPLGG